MDSSTDSWFGGGECCSRKGKRRQRRKRVASKASVVQQLKSLVEDLTKPTCPKMVDPPGMFDPDEGRSLRSFLRSYGNYFDSRVGGSGREKGRYLRKFLLGIAREAYDRVAGSITHFSQLVPRLLECYRHCGAGGIERFSASDAVPRKTIFFARTARGGQSSSPTSGRKSSVQCGWCGKAHPIERCWIKQGLCKLCGAEHRTHTLGRTLF